MALATVSMTLNKLTRRTAFRLAALFAALFSLTIIIIFTVLYISITVDLNAHFRSHVNEVINALVYVDNSGDAGALSKMVERHAAVAQSDEDIYLLTDQAGHYIAGNIQPIPRFEGWQNIAWRDLPLIGDWSGQRSSTAVFGKWTAVKNGWLFLADGNGDIIEAQSVLLKGLGWGVALATALGLLGGLLPGISAERRVSNMEAALDAVARGELTRRVPRSSSTDDLDHVAALINATLDRLQNLIESLKQVTNDIAHDLKTPISSVRHKLELAQQSSTDDASHHQNINDALSDIDNIVETFEALLRIAEIEGGQRRAKFTDVDLKEILSNVVEALAPVAEDTGHKIETNLKTIEPQVVRGDRQLLTQLWVNLIENSIRHCPRGSRIGVELTHPAANPLVVISDTGPGIPKAEQENVFRRLYRLEKSRTTPGNGLGLSLAAAIADLHGAKITLSENEPGLKVAVAFAGATP